LIDPHPSRFPKRARRQKDQHFFYSFHYTAELPFTLEVIKIDLDAPDGHYPKLLEAHGHLNLHAIEHGRDAWQHELMHEDGAGEFKVESVEPEAEGEDAEELIVEDYQTPAARDVSSKQPGKS
jgi:hypothetical protein